MSIDAGEAKWRAESDVRSLVEADIIRKDKARLKSAVNAAKSMAKKEEEEAKATKKVAKMGLKKKATKKKKK